VWSPNGAIPLKQKHLIGLGVAAQIPCDYYVYAHTLKAKQAGATEAEIKEASPSRP
jgi:AhpD family alkylhydroperoxidase